MSIIKPKTIDKTFLQQCCISPFFKKDLILPNFCKFTSNAVLIELLEYLLFLCGKFKHKKVLKKC